MKFIVCLALVISSALAIKDKVEKSKRGILDGYNSPGLGQLGLGLPVSAGRLNPYLTSAPLAQSHLLASLDPRYSSLVGSRGSPLGVPSPSASHLSSLALGSYLPASLPVASRYASYNAANLGGQVAPSAAAGRSLYAGLVVPPAAGQAAFAHGENSAVHASSSLSLHAAQSLSQAQAAIRPAAQLALRAAGALTEAHANLQPAAALAAQAASRLSHAQAQVQPAAQLAAQSARAQAQAQAALHSAQAQAAAQAAQAQAAIRAAQAQSQARAAQLQAAIKSHLLGQYGLASLAPVKPQSYARPLALGHSSLSPPSQLW